MSYVRRAAVMVAVALALGGCWPMSGQNADRTAYNPSETHLTPATVGALTRAWSTQSGGGAVQDPVVSSHGVSFTRDDCSATTVDAATGRYRWSALCGSSDPNNVDLLFLYETSPPVVSGDTIAFGGWGVVDYPQLTPDEPFVLPTRVVAATGGPAADAPNALPAAVRGGDELWAGPRFEYGGSPPYPFPVLVNSVANAEISVHRADGTSKGFSTDGGGRPTLGRHAVFQSSRGKVRALPLADGGPSWEVTLDSSASDPVLAPDQSAVFVHTLTGTAYALDAATGGVLWQGAAGPAASLQTVALADGTLFVPTDGGLVAFAAGGCGAATCTPAWSATTGAALSVQPGVAGGVVYTGSQDGSVDAFPAAGCGAATCAALWSDDTGSWITGAPAVANGRLFVGTRDGRLIAYH